MNFITFEGGEGSGKSTQAKLLVEALNRTGVDSVYTREPGGTPEAEIIRETIISDKLKNLDPITELFLHNAARNEHIKKFILPSIEQGKIIICDRFVDSTVAYQGYGHKLGRKIPAMFHNLCQEAIVPDLTFILDIDASIGLSRAKKSGKANHYEEKPLDFHERVRKGFLEIAKLANNRCTVIDAGKSVDEIHNIILNMVNTRYDIKINVSAI